MKKIVIVGGGFAGSLAARELEHNFDVTLIDTKDYFEFTPSVLRTLVEPQHCQKIEILHNHYLHHTFLVQNEVTAIDNQQVYTASNHYPYDYAIIASGSRYNSPIKADNLILARRARDLKNCSHQLSRAKSVLIIGGGVVGVELAAEIICKFPHKQISLVHGGQELIERNPRRARRYAENVLKSRGVKLIYNELVEQFGKKEYKTNHGSRYKADIAFLCTGIKPNFEMLEPYMAASLNQNKAVIVNKYLQVNGYHHIFAAGDITSIKEEKTAQSAEKQAKVVVKNIYNLEQGKPLQEFKATSRPMVISLGPWRGIFVKGKLVLTGLAPGLLKTLIEWKALWKYR